MYCLYSPKPYLIQPNAQVGLGLLSLATYAKSLGSPVSILNAQSQSEAEAVEMVPPEATVCMSGCLVDTSIVNRIGQELRAKGCYVAVGGPMTDSPELIHPEAADAIVIGRGEPFIHELTEGRRPVGRVIPQVETWNPGKYPPPDRSLLGKHQGGNIFHPRTGVVSEKSATLLTTRGCKYHCAFCRSGARQEFYPHQLHRIASEIRQIADLGIEYVRVADDNLLADPIRASRVCGMLSQHEIKWRASLRTYPHDIGLYREMAANGCLELNLGVESADPAVLKMIRKGSTVESNSLAVRNAVAAGIPHVRALFMVATPGETESTLALNQLWVERHPEVTVCLTAFVPFPCTAIYEAPHKFNCRIELDPANANFYAYHADGSEPQASVGIMGGMSREELTRQLLEFRAFLAERDRINHG